jgi:XTP/dITP diphosphohydrolase
MKDIVWEARTARFQCVLVYMRHANDPTPLIAQGTWEGLIAEAPQGTEGFGYDPVFYLPHAGITAAELSREEKTQLSHRAKAVKQMLYMLKGML